MPTEFAVVTRDRVRIAFDHYAGEGDRVLVVCPGFFKSKETPTFRRMARELLQACGMDLVVMDFRGHGRSQGRYAFSAREEADLSAVLGWGRLRYDAISVLGFSLGAAIAINTVSRHPERVRRLIGVSAPAVFEEIEFRWWTPEAIRRGLQGLEPGAGCRPGSPLLPKTKPIERVRELRSIPVLFIHGTRDVIVGVEHGRRLYAAAPEPKQLEIIPGGSHAEALFRDAPSRFVGLVASWLTTSPSGSKTDSLRRTDVLS